MPITNYTELQAAVLGWLNREDDAELAPRVPEFITLGEAAINRKLRVREQVTTLDMNVATPQFPVPPGYLQTQNLSHHDGQELEYVTPQAALRLKQQQHGVTGKPRYYTQEGENLKFIPEPSTTDGSQYDMTHIYYQRVPPLSTTNPTNWLLTKHPDFYLTAALYYANEYLRDQDGMKIAAARMDDIYEALRVQNEIDKTSTTPVMRAVPIG